MNEQARAIWDQKAAWWDERRAADEGAFFWPVLERLLELQPGQRVLDVACGNGVFARRMAAAGAQVLACDFSAEFIRLAAARTPPELAIAYRQADATDEAALHSLGSGFDAVLCSLALMDMADIEPLAGALPRLLKPGGRFVFSTTHPLNNTSTTRLYESGELDGQERISRALKLSRYLTPGVAKGLGMRGEPLPHLYFERPLQLLLRPFFEAGLAMDAFEELPYPEPEQPQDPSSWYCFREFPVFMMARLRLA